MIKKWRVGLFVLGAAITALACFYVSPRAAYADSDYGRNYLQGYLGGEENKTPPGQFMDWLFVPTTAAPYEGLGPGCDSDAINHCTTNPAQGGFGMSDFFKVYKARLNDTSNLKDGSSSKGRAGIGTSRLVTGYMDQGRAAAVIDIMLGVGDPGTKFGNGQQGYDKGVAYAKANFGLWEQIVEEYDSGNSPGYSVNWNYKFNDDCSVWPSGQGPCPYTVNGMGMNGVKNGDNDTMSFCNKSLLCGPDITFDTFNDDATDYAVEFNFPKAGGGEGHFIIKKKCGNLTGDRDVLPRPPQPQPYNLKPTVTPSIPGGASVASPDETVKFKYYIANVGQNNSPGGAACTSYPSEHAGQYQPNPPNYDKSGGGPMPGTIGAGCAQKFTQGASTPGVEVGSESVGITDADVGKSVCRTLSITPANAKGGTSYGESCVFVADLPYVAVNGGDVSVGAGMTADDGTCTNSNYKEAGIVSWNQEAAGNYAGAGTQYAAFALDYLQDFATAQDGNGGTSSNPSKLAFANTDPNYVQPPDLFGGNFGGYQDCMPDYFNGHSNATPKPPHTITQNSGDLGTTIYMQGNVKINALNVHNNTQTVVYVDGNVDITGNINFSGSYASVDKIPSFDLIVKGNIYIAPGVGQISGLYVAEPNVSGVTASDGVTYTCAQTPYRTAATSPTDANTYLTNNLYAQCRANPLTVNGSLVARQVWLLRASGSLGSNAAENVNFVPEFWLNTPPGTTTGNAYDAITSLPPVL